MFRKLTSRHPARRGGSRALQLRPPSQKAASCRARKALEKGHWSRHKSRRDGGVKPGAQALGVRCKDIRSRAAATPVEGRASPLRGFAIAVDRNPWADAHGFTPSPLRGFFVFHAETCGYQWHERAVGLIRHRVHLGGSRVSALRISRRIRVAQKRVNP